MGAVCCKQGQQTNQVSGGKRPTQDPSKLIGGKKVETTQGAARPRNYLKADGSDSEGNEMPPFDGDLNEQPSAIEKKVDDTIYFTKQTHSI